jgi:phospholipid/cholesterol/gamma-HCH transport system substrate-binding protein
MAPSRRAAVGAFVIAGVLIFGVGLFLIGDRRLLFVDRYELYTQFGRVTGVQVGTGVRVAGLAAGEVTEVIIPPGPADRFRVRMRIRQDLQPLVRTDSVAAIQTDGIVGNAFIQVGGGTESAAIAPAGSTIEGRDPIEFADLIEEGRDTFRAVSKEIIDLRGDISEAIDVLTVTLEEANALIGEVGADAKLVAAEARRITADAAETAEDVKAMVADVRAGKGNIGKFLTSDEVWVSTRNMARDGEETLSNIRQASDDLRGTIERFRAEGGPTDRLVADLTDAVGQAREVMSDLAENTEAMKRHWLLRGFFRDRGYFDLDTLTVDQYRRGAVEQGDRAALRIWIEASNLFETRRGGSLALSDAGRRRLDVAMADVLGFPRDTPIVVEGYATSDAPAERYLLADERSRLVDDYIQQRYRRDSTLVGHLAIGLDAEDSPSGDGRWDGVAIAAFVKKDLLARAQSGGTTD